MAWSRHTIVSNKYNNDLRRYVASPNKVTMLAVWHAFACSFILIPIYKKIRDLEPQSRIDYSRPIWHPAYICIYSHCHSYIRGDILLRGIKAYKGLPHNLPSRLSRYLHRSFYMVRCFAYDPIWQWHLRPCCEKHSAAFAFMGGATFVLLIATKLVFPTWAINTVVKQSLTAGGFPKKRTKLRKSIPFHDVTKWKNKKILLRKRTGGNVSYTTHCSVSGYHTFGTQHWTIHLPRAESLAACKFTRHADIRFFAI